MSSASTGQQNPPILRVPGMPALLGVSLLGFAGYALLLPTAPLWATRGGADEGGAGLVNAVLMLATVVFQTTVPWALRRLGWRVTLIAGVLLLGLPSFALVLTDQLAGILAVSAVRGAGYAIVTVCGASAIAELVDAARRGRAIGVYGLAVAGPQLVLVPSAAWIAESVDFRVVFAVGARGDGCCWRSSCSRSPPRAGRCSPSPRSSGTVLRPAWCCAPGRSPRTARARPCWCWA